MSRASPLAKVQSALAAILMEPEAMAAFRRDPQAYARRAGLAGAHSQILAGLPVEGAAYFASRRVIDRHHYLRADLPRCVAALDAGAGLAASYFADCPYAKEDPRAEVRQFAAWAKAAARSGRAPAALADLAAIEAAGMLLMDKEHAVAAPARRLTRAPGVVVLRLRHDPDGLLGDEPLQAAAGRFTTVLVREPDDVEVYRLGAASAALLALADGKRTARQAVAAVAREHGARAAQEALRTLRRLRVVRPERPAAKRP